MNELTKSLFWREHVELDNAIIFNLDYKNPSVTCVNCDMEIGHPSILEHTNYECPRCGFKYKDRED